MTAATATAVLPAMDAAHLAMTEAAKLRPSPSVPGSMEAAVKMWLQVGNLQKLQQAVLDGYGWLLKDHTSRLPHVNKFLRKVPDYQEKIDTIHEQVIRGDLNSVRRMLEKKGWSNARDHYGHSPLHKSVMANQEDIMRYLLNNFPDLIGIRDNENRTPLHYAAALQGTTGGVNQLYNILVDSGADENAVDVQGHSPSYYKEHPQDIRHRTVQSRRPAPQSTHLIKGDPDSATSPSKYLPDPPHPLPDVALTGQSAQSRLPKPKPRSTATNLGSALSLIDYKNEEEFGDEDGIINLDDADLDAIIYRSNEMTDFPKHPGSSKNVNFRTLSTSSSEVDTRPLKREQTPKLQVPKRKTKRKRKVSPPKIKPSQANDGPTPRPKLPMPASKHPAATVPDEDKALDSVEEFENLAKMDERTLRALKKKSAPEVSMVQIRNLIHKSESNIKVSDIKKAMRNAQRFGKSYQDENNFQTSREGDPKEMEINPEKRNLSPAQIKPSRKLQYLTRSPSKSKPNSSLSTGQKAQIVERPPSPKLVFGSGSRLPLADRDNGQIPKSEGAKLKEEKKNQSRVVNPARSNISSTFTAGPSKPSPGDSAKRLELIKAARRTKKLNSSSPIVNNHEIKTKHQKMALPLVTRSPEKKGAKKKGTQKGLPNIEADEEFYRDFRIIYVTVPIPADELPIPPPTRAYLRTLIHNSDLEHLEKVVLDGHGFRLMSESSAIGKVTKFLSTLPDFMDTISILHNAVTAGVVPVVQELLTTERLALSRDQYGATPLHKSVLFYQPKIVKLITEKFKITTRAKDQEGRTPLHYSAALNDSGIFYRYLLKCGADEHIQDKYGKTAKFYVYAPGDLDLNVLVSRCKEMPRKREHHEIRKYSIPPAQQVQQEALVNAEPHRVMSTSEIRNFIRQSDTEHLEHKKIEHLHESVVQNDLPELQVNLTRRKLAISKDDQGFGLLHKAVFLGHRDIVHWLLDKFPETMEVKDWLSSTMLSPSASRELNRDLHRHNSVSNGDLPSLVRVERGSSGQDGSSWIREHRMFLAPISNPSQPSTTMNSDLELMALSNGGGRRSAGRSLENRAIGAYYKHLERFKVPRTESWMDLQGQIAPQGRPNILKPLKIVPPVTKSEKPTWIYGNPWSMSDKKLRRFYKSSDGLNSIDNERIFVIKTPHGRSKSSPQDRAKSLWDLRTPSTSSEETNNASTLTMSNRGTMVPFSPLPSLEARKTIIQGRGSRVARDDEDSDQADGINQRPYSNMKMKRLHSICVPVTKKDGGDAEVMTFHHELVKPDDLDEGVDVSGDVLRLSSLSLSHDSNGEEPRVDVPKETRDPFQLSDDDDKVDSSKVKIKEVSSKEHTLVNENHLSKDFVKDAFISRYLNPKEDLEMDEEEASMVLEAAFLDILKTDDVNPELSLKSKPIKRQTRRGSPTKVSPERKRLSLAERARSRALAKMSMQPLPPLDKKDKDRNGSLKPIQKPLDHRSRSKSDNLVHFTQAPAKTNSVLPKKSLKTPQSKEAPAKIKLKKRPPKAKSKEKVMVAATPLLPPTVQVPSPVVEEDVESIMDEEEATDVLETAFLLMLEDSETKPDASPAEEFLRRDSVPVRLFTDFSDSMSSQILESVKHELKHRQFVIIREDGEDEGGLIEKGIDSFDQVDGRIPLHYTACNPKASEFQTILVSSGSEESAEDSKGKTVQYYLEHKDEITIPDWNPKPILMPPSPKKSVPLKAGAGIERAAMSLKSKREDRETKEALERKLSSPEKKPSPRPAAIDGMEINPTNIRIWIHERDISNLERVVWEGFGHLLTGQTSSHSKIRKFLEATPKLMNDIKEVHEAAVLGNVDPIINKEYRQPIYTSKDINGIPAFHKAVANGHREVAQHLMEKTDRSVLNVTDRHGRYALHYAAGIADEDDKAMYNWLIEYGAEDHKADELMKAPSYYITNPQKIKYLNCSLIPEAPRIIASPRKESAAVGKSATSAKPDMNLNNNNNNNNNHHQKEKGSKSPTRAKSRSVSPRKRKSSETERKGINGVPEWKNITKEHVSQ
ncbi:hypothetical protein TCAL_09905 [Tigriopus californicus]|uniref:Uncharacterized protein n=1 Tax=Tigriopus californicus TaxID=6832 RepID=A0A553PN54_TIGCA|nr:hypothetical protein TCAL_09905 [Tigriopus californicus]